MRDRLPWNFTTRAAALVWVFLIAGIALHAYFYPGTHTVYDIYAPAARSWWAGRDLYQRTTDYFRYSPLVAISFTPFAVLPDELGGAVWKIVNCLVFALGLRSWIRHLLPPDLTATEIAMLFLLVLPICLHSMYIGQANMMMLGAILLSLGAAAKGRWNRSAAWLAWATLIKGYPLALAMLLAALWPKRFALRFVVSLAIGLLLPFLAQQPSVVAMQYASWFTHLRDSTGILHERARSLDHLLETYQVLVSPHAFALTGMAAGLFVLGVALSEREVLPGTGPRLRAIFSWFVTWLVLFGPAIEACTYAALSPAIAWALVDSWRRRSGWVGRLLLGSSFLLAGPAVTDAFGPTFRRFANEHALQPIGAILFLAYLLLQLGHHALGQPDTTPKRKRGQPMIPELAYRLRTG
jgi:Glycosyltransferase family 87